MRLTQKVPFVYRYQVNECEVTRQRATELGAERAAYYHSVLKQFIIADPFWTAGPPLSEILNDNRYRCWRQRFFR